MNGNIFLLFQAPQTKRAAVSFSLKISLVLIQNYVSLLYHSVLFHGSESLQHYILLIKRIRSVSLNAVTI
jgi:hypothetical protein